MFPSKQLLEGLSKTKCKIVSGKDSSSCSRQILPRLLLKAEFLQFWFFFFTMYSRFSNSLEESLAFNFNTLTITFLHELITYLLLLSGFLQWFWPSDRQHRQEWLKAVFWSDLRLKFWRVGLIALWRRPISYNQVFLM